MAPTYEPISEKPHPADLGGVRRKYQFDNGYGASVVRTSFSYGGDAGLWELAVLGPDGHLDYSTPVTNDVIGYLTDDAVQGLLAEIAALPASKAPTA